MMIWSDLRKPAPSSPPDAERGARDSQVIIEHVCELTLELAEEYKSRFEQAPWIYFEWLELCIIPVPDVQGYEAITLLALGSTEQGCLIIGHDAVGGVESFAHEADVPLEQRYALGLLTPPRAGR